MTEITLGLLLALAGFVPEVSARSTNVVGGETSSTGPRIQFAEPVFDFGRVKSGEVIKHAFILTNIGDQVLEVTNVQTACGCTAAGEWSRRVEPGQSGRIPIEFMTANFSGAVLKTVSVASTDKSQPVVTLEIKGTLWKPVDVVPAFAVLNIPPDARTGKTVVKIVNNTEEFITIAALPNCSNPALQVAVSTNQPGKEFEMDIRAGPGLPPGNIQAQVTLQTTSTNLPVVTVNVWVVVQPALAVLPARVILPPAPLAVRTVQTVIVQSNSTNTFTLTNASVRLRGVDIAVQENIPGRAYTLNLTFPAGYELPPASPAALTFQTSLAEFSFVTVPIAHAPKPAAIAPPAPASAPPPPGPLPQQSGAPRE